MFVFFIQKKGLTEPRRSRSGGALPPPRTVSFMLHQDVSDYDNEVTYLVIAWGQMLDHDITFAAVPRGMLFFKCSNKSLFCLLSALRGGKMKGGKRRRGDGVRDSILMFPSILARKFEVLFNVLF